MEKEYDKAMAEFVGNTYKGARDSAASRGRTIKIWHYGSKAPARTARPPPGEMPSRLTSLRP